MNPLYDFDDIDDYMQGRMSDADRAAFEAALAADAELTRRVDALRAEAAVLRGLRREALLEKMSAWENEISLHPKVVSLWYRRWPLTAAAAAIAALLVWALWRSFQTEPAPTGIAGQPGLHDSSIHKTAPDTAHDNTPEIAAGDQEKSALPPQKQAPAGSSYTELAISNFNADYSSINLMGAPDVQKDKNPLQLAAVAIAQKKYETALAHLKKIPTANADDHTAAQIMAGDIYFLQKKFALAAKTYSEPAKSKKDKFRDVAQWRLLLASLAMYPQKSTDFERVMSVILDDPDHPYFDSAKKVQSEMKRQ